MKQNYIRKSLLGLGLLLLIPGISHAQDTGDNIYSLHQTLSNLFDEMMPLCRNMISVGRAIAGLGALFFIAMKVWGHIARAEPIDFYPLLRPFAIGLAIILFPSLIYGMNGVLKPITDATAAMAKDSHKAIEYFMQKQEAEIMNQPETASTGTGNADSYSQYEQPEDNGESSGFLGSISQYFDWKNKIKEAINELLQIVYMAAGLAIDAIRTFYLLVLTIIGPIVLGISVFGGLHHTLEHWFARYIHVYMWLPVANIFGAISAKVLALMMTDGQVSMVAYMIFLVISIIGYTTVPSVAAYIVQPGGGGRDTLLSKATRLIPGMKGG